MNRKLVLSQGNTHQSTQIRNRAPQKRFSHKPRSRAVPEPPLPAGRPGPAHPLPAHPEALPRLPGRAGLRVGQGLAVGAAPRLQLRLGDVGQGALDLLEQHIPAVHHLLQPRRRLVVLLLQPVQTRSLQSKTGMMPKDFRLFTYFSYICTPGCYYHSPSIFSTVSL